MENPLGSRDVQQRITEASDRYRAAFAAVESFLATHSLDPVPSWVFAIDRLPIENLETISEELAVLEANRRSARQALCSLIELIALRVDTPNEGLDEDGQVDVSAVMQQVPASGDENWKESLDRFITIVERARVNGCIYLNGTFTPVNARDNEGSAEDVR